MPRSGNGEASREGKRQKAKTQDRWSMSDFNRREMLSFVGAAQIPEELAFQKGDILAVLRLQDDGWWEAEVVGKNSRPGLVPSNYLNPV